MSSEPAGAAAVPSSSDVGGPGVGGGVSVDGGIGPGVGEAQRRAERDITERVLASFAGTADPRLRTLLCALVEHLHALAREVRLTEGEWQAVIAFLTATGHITDERRQEFILLSDVLGLSMQTVTIGNPVDGGPRSATEATVFGPFFTDDSPRVDLGGDIAGGAGGEPCWVEGSVSGTDGEVIAGARIEVWEADDDGLYDVQYDDHRTAARGHLFSGEDGGYRFWALTPTPYPIPADGPVGRLLAATGRSPYRAPHLHFMVAAPGYRTLITHIFVAGGDHLDSDSVFGVKESLIKQFHHRGQDPAPDGRDLDGRAWSQVRFDVVLAPA